ncbi:hypothetical protein DFR50_12917 [Roseiarcus fermentans]|uniref:Uncharacterized protein n=1 Tax=Roseiarcus fermentans TaxID=1473586 RepID=A0A366EXH3_9HYPH|nr:hypothetical protein DFR50_12917 [Roseiarcus fermentans]
MEGFTKRYGLKRLVYMEFYEPITSNSVTRPHFPFSKHHHRRCKKE